MSEPLEGIHSPFDFTWNRVTKTVTIQFRDSWWEPRPAVIRQTHPHMKERLRPQELDVEYIRNTLIEILNEGVPQ